MHLASHEKDPLTAAEERYLKILYSHCKDIFTPSPLPSHDHNHHLRVWFYASDLLKHLQKENILLSHSQTANLILAVFFHDTGLTKTLKKEHGAESRKLCENFLTNNPRLFHHDVEQALLAIEMHDDKDYGKAGQKTAIPDILSILSVCDDFDAYGAIGVIRYAEIYLLRGITPDELPLIVLQNLERRYNYSVSHKWIPREFFNKQKKRYEFTAGYYSKMAGEPESGEALTNAKIIDLYLNLVYSGKTGLPGYISSLSNSGNDFFHRYGIILKSELESFFINLPV